MSLAEAAFYGALAYHPDYADAHYHLARLLDRLDRHSEASNIGGDSSTWRLPAPGRTRPTTASPPGPSCE